MGSVTCQKIWDQFWQSQQAIFIHVQCGQMVRSFALGTTHLGSVTCQQIWDQFWLFQRAMLILAQCGQMVISSALEATDIGIVTFNLHQISDQCCQSQRAISTLVHCVQMVSSSALERTNPGSVTVPEDLGPVLAVSAGNAHTCAVRADGSLVCFGDCHGKCEVPHC